MKNKICSIDETKLCNDCGECTRCLLDPKKECDNCGDCIKVDRLGDRKITIDNIEDAFYHNANLDDITNKDDIFDHFMLYDVNDENHLNDLNDNDALIERLYSPDKMDEIEKAIEDFRADLEDYKADVETDENGVEIEHIEDIDGLSDLINDEENHDKYFIEEFPGLLKFDKDYKSHKKNRNK
jgi:hypothetical protein